MNLTAAEQVVGKKEQTEKKNMDELGNYKTYLGKVWP